MARKMFFFGFGLAVALFCRVDCVPACAIYAEASAARFPAQDARGKIRRR